MTESENSILEHLKPFQAGQERMERALKEVQARVSRVESGQGLLIQHIGRLSSSIAGRQASMDHMRDQFDRIEHRLELA
jgi:uncharacterized coiled-coil protein SlyX